MEALEPLVRKRWRVGTLSMGVSLISLGLTLLVSSWQGIIAFDTLIKLWPIIFVLLGCEILLYLFLSRSEKPILHYDVFSIAFVSFLCLCCLLFSLLTSTGLMEEFRYTINSNVATADLPDTKFDVPVGIEKIIVQTADRKLKIDTNSLPEIRLLGIYQKDVTLKSEQPALKSEDVVTTKTIGKTMYVLIKQLPEKRGFERDQPVSSMILVVPQAIPVEVLDAYNNIIKPN
ncbi:hypothetical protein EHS13_00150 [Paenibacillus psychroresistens]|uniref:Exosporium protein E n=1 Tax=Paenibacillus psychroresistens TaxID=1778678 RepID=A0A6B8R9D5_9BACL|nr:hypothetical protein [Paenibacillus psychroresistens]QGQ93449.1 hypothetical protein EHS13_00150 [Paenibacillus psychroresistens]